MEQFSGAMLFSAIFVALLADMCSQRRTVDALIEALNNFRGGPPTPMHPSPANDGAFLRQRSPKSDRER